MKKRAIFTVILVVLIIFLVYSYDCLYVKAKIRSKFVPLLPGEKWRVIAYQAEFATNGALKRGWVLLTSKSIVLSQTCIDKEGNIYVQGYTSIKLPVRSDRGYSFTVIVKNIPYLFVNGIPAEFNKVSTRDCEILAYDDLPIVYHGQ